jgi:hypothetical protein
MAYSYVRYGSDGVQTLFTFPFAYLSEDHIVVRFDGVDSDAWDFQSANAITLNEAPEFGTTIEIRRITPLPPIVDYTDGATLTESDLDRNATQWRYVAEETRDIMTDFIETLTFPDGFPFMAANIQLSSIPAAPGAGLIRLVGLAGTTEGTAKIVAYAGISETPIPLLNNIGSGFVYEELPEGAANIELSSILGPPGANLIRIVGLNGTTPGTAKLQVYAGTSSTPVPLLNNIGNGF